ncbi:twin-arginine translocase TatA/TatE family subunit [Flavobacterium sp.]|uniref:twin-arginine translocase TatA/TatE family subunit n=1 Tax=Flavobacterium sp. TaxID=239 RepID=UPI00286CA1F3|nr:twin-arginine translocase TatA/TatE family subunit [Flavobacterium sp.]
MFGIGGGELIFILFIALMLFGSDKIPEIARTLGKIMAQLKNATNDIKSEIQKGAEANGLDKTFQEMHGNFTGITENINSEINKAKDKLLADTSVKDDVTAEVEDVVGPIKRQK